MSKSAHSRQYKTLRKLLSTTRTDAGLTQQEVAAALGMHQSYVSKYETGERRLDVVELRGVCYALGISPSGFMRRLDRLLST